MAANNCVLVQICLLLPRSAHGLSLLRQQPDSLIQRVAFALSVASTCFDLQAADTTE